ncbi:MAG: tetratricopeptide repeat protein [Microcoleus sp. PH2017_01_SCD_O_A]|uniref:tetratricopeptide repeat protein n=1 Tax=unclassified Microcoleus TaxID=2642155 RepID=UPI001D1C1C93|nr:MULTISPECIES: tetratricopeptide repeat protein [unclassified Microcoleus]TAG65452.1 MAG: tetratricopeptide repeat protein [Oscillatoriales cyanobacterium]MCC3424654.1 tetratricopeptide repeat protein [Microcoleus sp. PH2017_01_SCD_O_A]MCC3454681.1 tetratricopeptide repeat protein [Microcoleus sp. PH2017_08_TRC_O_A]MCC3473374.1 tetratricopeptide repeat protein [Microcoleus sp. PH2017_13_LAR_U_A]MCC3485691.1 tetratricopeptide repeat protein [Microcoleus sp. PH2017_14_LAR_D_A]
MNNQKSTHYFNRGNQFKREGKWGRAIIAYRKSIVLKPNFSWSHHNLAEAFSKVGRWDAAIACYRTACNLNPNSAWSHYKLGEILILQGTQDEAIIHFQKAIEIIPHFHKFYESLGLALVNNLVKNKDFDRVIICFVKLFELNHNPDFVFNLKFRKELSKEDQSLFYYRLGDALTKITLLEAAVSCYIKATHLEPNNSQAYYQLLQLSFSGKFQLSSSHLGELAAIYSNAINSSYSNNPDCYINLAHILTAQGKTEQAITTYQKGCYHKTLASHPEFVDKYWNQSKATGPNFLVIGAAKCGTTSLYNNLVLHPRILPATHKELSFFNWHFSQGLDWYVAHFPPIDHPELFFFTGEATPDYFFYTDMVEKRVFDFNPGIKLILLLRNPIEKTISHYQHAIRLGYRMLPFEDFMNLEIEKTENMSEDYTKLYNGELGVLQIGLYVYFLQKWMKIFSEEQILILKSEDLFAYPQKNLNKVFKFLGTHEHNINNFSIDENKGNYLPINDHLRRRLCEFFLPHNQLLEEYLGRKLYWD